MDEEDTAKVGRRQHIDRDSNFVIQSDIRTVSLLEIAVYTNNPDK